MTGTSPTVRQRELGKRLRELRDQSGLTVEAVAEKLLCSATKISRLETGARRPSLRDVRDLCALYGVDESSLAELMNLARGAREQGWWTQYEGLKPDPLAGLAQRPQVRSKIFISYVREDSAAVDRIAAELRSHGVDVWLDRNDLEVGDRWKEVIRNAIRYGDYFLACFSPAYGRRSNTYMNEELLVAIEELRLRPRDRRWFLPITLGECIIPAYPIGPAETLKDIHHIDLGQDWKRGLASLVRVLVHDAT